MNCKGANEGGLEGTARGVELARLQMPSAVTGVANRSIELRCIRVKWDGCPHSIEPCRRQSLRHPANASTAVTFPSFQWARCTYPYDPPSQRIGHAISCEPGKGPAPNRRGPEMAHRIRDQRITTPIWRNQHSFVPLFPIPVSRTVFLKSHFEVRRSTRKLW